MIDTSSIILIEQLTRLPSEALPDSPSIIKHVERANPQGTPVSTPKFKFFGTRRAFSKEGEPLPSLSLTTESELKTDKASKLPPGVDRLVRSMRTGEVAWAWLEEKSYGLPLKNDIWLRVEITREEKYKESFGSLSFAQQTEFIEEKKKEGDQLLLMKSFEEAEKKYTEAYHLFKGQKKADLKVLSQEAKDKRTLFGLKLCKNLIRAAFNSKHHNFAIEVGTFAQSNLSKNDEVLNELIAQTKLESKDPTAFLKINPEHVKAKEMLYEQNKLLCQAFKMAFQNNPQEDLRETLMKKTNIRTITNEFA